MLNLRAAASSARTPSGITSLPMPSPAMTAILCCFMELLCASENALAEFHQCCFGQAQSQPWRLLQREPPVGDFRRVLEQFRLQRIALRIRERLDDTSSRTGGDDVGMDEAVVVGGNLHVIELAQRREFSPLREAA